MGTERTGQFANANGDASQLNTYEITMISVISIPDINLNKSLNQQQYIDYAINSILVGYICQLKFIDVADKSVAQTLLNQTPVVRVDKPYYGVIATPFPGLPTKIYVGAINKTTYVYVGSSESDAMFTSLLQNLRIIPKSQGSAESIRLEAMKRELGVN